jgi:hypothetical protein
LDRYGNLYRAWDLYDLLYQLFVRYRYVLLHEPFNGDRHAALHDLFDWYRYTHRCGNTDRSWHRHLPRHEVFNGYRNIACDGALYWYWDRYLMESFHRYRNGSIDKLLHGYRYADIFIDEHVVGLWHCTLHRSVNRIGHLASNGVINRVWYRSFDSPFPGNGYRHALRDRYSVRSVNGVLYDVVHRIRYRTIHCAGNGIRCWCVDNAGNCVWHGYGLRYCSLNRNRNIVRMFDDLVNRHRVVSFNEFFGVVRDVIHSRALHRWCVVVHGY